MIRRRAVTRRSRSPEVFVGAHPARIRFAALFAIAVLVVGCTGGSSSPSAPGTPSGSTAASGGTTPATTTQLVVGLGYLPSVQFAQFYFAQQAGYYRDAGLQVTFQNKIDPDLIPLLGQGAIDIGNGDGTSVIPAVSQGIPIRYVATIYGSNPSIVFAKASSGIARAQDLKGRKIGIPGKYGASWITLQALLSSAGLTTNDVQLVLYPDFGQEVALAQGAVDAATGYANNDVVQLELSGTKAVVLSADTAVPLPGPGLVVGQQALTTKHDALKAFVAATLRAMTEIAADPQKGVDASIAAVPDLGKDPATQLAILRATIATWPNTRTGAPIGAIDRDGWTSSIAFMTKLGLVPNPVTVDQLVTAELLPAQ